MARHTILLLLITISILLLAGSVAGYCRQCSRARAFLRASCSCTRYPMVCEKSLSKYVNGTNLGHKQLAEIALRVSLTEARFTRAYLTNMARRLTTTHYEESHAIGDCIDQINDSVAQLRLAIRELKRCRNQESLDNFMWYMSNVETWTSTALTDQINCAAVFDGDTNGKVVRSTVRARVEDVTQITSNALALLNRFVTRYRFVRAGKHLKP